MSPTWGSFTFALVLPQCAWYTASRCSGHTSRWPNWTRRLTTNQKIGGSSPSRDTALRSCSLAVEHRSYEPGVAGSIPARSTRRRACSVMVIIDASQALDPGSIPGRRRQSFFASFWFFFFWVPSVPLAFVPHLQTRRYSSVGRASD